VNFNGAVAPKAVFKSANLLRASFEKTELDGANFCLAELGESRFDAAKCPFGIFEFSNIDLASSVSESPDEPV
jgi:uncharacterized protein YjbI with pentapeptide repeats